MEQQPQQEQPQDASVGATNPQAAVSQPTTNGSNAPSSEAIMPPPTDAPATTAAAVPNAISADEIALYDRQIRLWGMDAQAKIQSANILLINMRALANEVAKNLVLAGVGSLTLLDSARVTEADLGAQFFQSGGGDSHVGKNRAAAASEAIRKLNPRVQVHVDEEGVKSKGPSYFSGFDIVIATDLDPNSFNLINTATRINNKAFYAAGTHGMYGFIFSDLIEHDYVIERDLGNVATQPKLETRTRSITNVQTKKEGPKTIEVVTKRELYSTWFLASDVGILPDEYIKSKRRLRGVSAALPCLRALWEFMSVQGGHLPRDRDDLKLFTQIATQKVKALSLPGETLTPEFLRSFLQNLGSEIAPVTAVLGGQLAQDVINVLGQKQQPIQNTVIFDGNTMESQMYALHPEGDLGASLLSVGTAIPDPNMIPNGAAINLMPNAAMLDANGMPINMGDMSIIPGADGFPMANPFAPNGLVPGMQMPPMPDMQQQPVPSMPVPGADLAQQPPAAPVQDNANGGQS